MNQLTQQLLIQLTQMLDDDGFDYMFSVVKTGETPFTAVSVSNEDDVRKMLGEMEDAVKTELINQRSIN